MTRLEANRKIVEKIAEAVENNPDWRFYQILQNIHVSTGEDQWYDESEKTLSEILPSPKK